MQAVYKIREKLVHKKKRNQRLTGLQDLMKICRTGRCTVTAKQLPQMLLIDQATTFAPGSDFLEPSHITAYGVGQLVGQKALSTYKGKLIGYVRIDLAANAVAQMVDPAPVVGSAGGTLSTTVSKPGPRVTVKRNA